MSLAPVSSSTPSTLETLEVINTLKGRAFRGVYNNRMITVMSRSPAVKESGSIECWGVDKVQLIWKDVYDNVIWEEKFFFTSEAVICPGEVGDRGVSGVIRILSLKDGNHLSKDIVRGLRDTKDRRYHQQVAVIGERIFAALCREETTEITEWNLKGELQKSIRMGVSCSLPTFQSCQGNLVWRDLNGYCDDKVSQLSIYNPDTAKKDSLEITGRVNKFFIDQKRLITCLSRGDGKKGQEKYDACCVIDRETGEKKLIRAQDAFLHKTDKGNLTEQGSAISVGVRGRWIYLGDNSGILAAIDADNGEYQKLGSHSRPVTFLSIEDRLMATSSTVSEIMLWDLERRTLLACIERPLQSPPLYSLQLHNGKLIAGTFSSVTIYERSKSKAESPSPSKDKDTDLKIDG